MSALKWKTFLNEDLRIAKESSLGLDLIRGISAQMVLIGHALSYYHIYPSSPGQVVFLMQNLGVLVFFILSGFLITLTTRKKAKEDPAYGFSGFFFDRLVRIYSAYLPAIIFVLIVDSMARMINPSGYSFATAFNFKHFIGNIVMLQDFPDLSGALPGWLSLTSFGSARPFWTIAIEWWFYLFFGWLFFIRRMKLNTIIKLVVLAVFLIMPLVNLRGGRANCLTYLWYAGFVLSFIYNSEFMKRLNKWVLLAALVFLGVVFRYYIVKFDLKVYNYQIGAIVAAVILALVVLFPKVPGIFRNEIFKRSIRVTADFSFSLYLIHYTILSFLVEILHFFTDKPWTGFLLSIVICNIAAILFASVTEFHHKRLRKYIFEKYKV